MSLGRHASLRRHPGPLGMEWSLGDRLYREGTVKARAANIRTRLSASDRAHAVTIGLRQEIIEL